VVGPTPAPPIVCQADGRAVPEHPARLQRLAPALQARGHPWRLAPGGEALQALRGVQGTVAGTTIAARGDLTRVTTPTPLMRDRGLTPSAASRGPRRSPAGSTTTGTRQARRALGEGAWADRDPATGRRPLQRRRAPRPTPSQDLTWQAQVRLCTRSRPRMARGPHAPQVVVASARAWVALRWAIARDLPLPA
jgi:hypothetical protein